MEVGNGLESKSYEEHLRELKSGRETTFHYHFTTLGYQLVSPVQQLRESTVCLSICVLLQPVVAFRKVPADMWRPQMIELIFYFDLP
ncbi:hypothetical protein BTVI_44351 [Pitangus sulphuratus]|nr:hypothetical protein BTVI_44351 [Pitangus sulphuratus]